MQTKRKSFIDGVKARLQIDVLIAYPRRRTLEITGYAESFAIRSELNDVKKRALQNALFKYLSETEEIPEEIYNSGAYIRQSLPNVKLQIQNYSVLYQEYKFLRIKREKRRGKYYNVVRSRKTGQFVSVSKWKNTQPSELVSEETFDELGVENEEM